MGSLQSLLQLKPGIAGENPSSGQSKIWSQNICMQSQRPNHCAFVRNLIITDLNFSLTLQDWILLSNKSVEGKLNGKYGLDVELLEKLDTIQ